MSEHILEVYRFILCLANFTNHKHDHPNSQVRVEARFLGLDHECSARVETRPLLPEVKIRCDLVDTREISDQAEAI